MGRNLIILFMFLFSTIGAATLTSGSISGKVVDQANQMALIGVNIYLESAQTGAATDSDGNFVIENLPAGSYTVKFSYIGYEPVTKTDIIVRPDRTTYINISMSENAVELENVTVTGGYYTNVENLSTSAVDFSSEEIRRAPGAAGDISRILFSLPSVAKVNDNSNSLIVRGGTPLENSFYIDNIEIPNINHYPTQGSSEGPIGILNVDFIEDVTFYSGGFSTSYGDRMSSVMDIKYREGSRDKFNSQVNLSFAGLSALAEGPIGDNGSYIAAANKSYLDLIFKAIDESGTVPEYGDFQTKLVFDIDKNNKISFLDILAIDYINQKYQSAFDNGYFVYGPTRKITNTAGINWRHIWGKSGYSNTSIGITYGDSDYEFFRTRTQQSLLHNLSKEITTTFRNNNYYTAGKTTTINFGIESKLTTNDYNLKYGIYYDDFGNVNAANTIDKNLNTLSASVFGEVKQVLFDNIVLDVGLRSDYFDYNNKVEISPRAGIEYKLSNISSVYARWGVFYQNVPSYVLVQSNSFKDLKTPKAEHFILGFDYMLNEETKLTLELYRKNYSNFPVDVQQPGVFLFDETVREHVFLQHENLVDVGEAYAQGVELVIQKKFAKDYYGLISGSYSTSRYKALDNKWYDRIFDNRYNFAIEGGYKPSSTWEFSLRWIYAGGRPDTPIDEAASLASGYEMLDTQHINSERLPAYHSLNIRFDKRWYFDNSNIVLYVSIWNVYGRENISEYYWDEVNQKKEHTTGWGMLPVLGVEWEF